MRRSGRLLFLFNPCGIIQSPAIYVMWHKPLSFKTTATD